MEATPVIVSLIILAAGIVFLVLRGDRHDREIKEIWRWQHAANACIKNLDCGYQTLQSNQSAAEAQSVRLLQEQLNLKMDAMDACKAMIRESARYERR
jgi:hypothetical protein